MAEKRPPSPAFYRVVAVCFLAIAIVLLWLAATRHEWFYWVIGIMTVFNALMAGLKSIVPPRESQR